MTDISYGPGTTSNQAKYAFRVSDDSDVPSQDAARTISSGFVENERGKSYFRHTSGWWPIIIDNPEFPEQCLASDPLRIAMLVDTSGSMNDPADGVAGSKRLDVLKQAATSFISEKGLGLTNTNLAVYSFAEQTVQAVRETSLTTTAGIESVKRAIQRLSATGGTNWDTALRTMTANLTNWDAVIMITDGNPTFWGAGTSGDDAPYGNGNATNLRNVEQAVFSANTLKARGTTLLAVGAGIPSNSIPNLRALAGDDVYTTDFSGLEDKLHNIAQRAQCQAGITVQKLVDEKPGDPSTKPEPQAGWEMTTTISNKNPSSPQSAPALGTVGADGNWTATEADEDIQLTSGDTGDAKWAIQYKTPRDTTASLTISEETRSGFTFSNVIVLKNGTVYPAGDDTTVQITDIAPGDSIQIIFTNMPDEPTEGSVRWQKVDAVDGTHLAGSEWVIARVDSSQAEIPVTDNTGQEDYQGRDQNPAPGEFEVKDLDLGRYTLQETSPPTGYQENSTKRSFTLDTGNASAGFNFGKITNSRILGQVTWEKVDSDNQDNHLGGSEWTLTPTNPAGIEITVTDNTGQPDYNGEDTDDREGFFAIEGLEWGTYTLTETTPPTNYDPSDGSWPITISATNLTVGIGKISNTLITGSVAWDKVDENDKPMGETTWTITPTSPAGSVITVVDNGSNDANKTAGSFLVEGLDIGSYELQETVTKDGYVLDTETYSFSITAANRNYSFDTAFVNRPVIIPPLPLTGGIGSEGYLIGGALALLLTAMAVTGTQLKKRRDAHVSQ